MRLLVLLVAILFAGCKSSAPTTETPRPDPTAESWYPDAVQQLQNSCREAERLLKVRKNTEVAAIITANQPLMTRLLAVPKPTLAAMEAASDLDHLYGRMLLANRHYGWARMLFQKNQARWTHWRPQTEETARRKALAESAIAECDRRLAQ